MHPPVQLVYVLLVIIVQPNQLAHNRFLVHPGHIYRITEGLVFRTVPFALPEDTAIKNHRIRQFVLKDIIAQQESLIRFLVLQVPSVI